MTLQNKQFFNVILKKYLVTKNTKNTILQKKKKKKKLFLTASLKSCDEQTASLSLCSSDLLSHWSIRGALTA